jgi:NADP-dependent aldehyde dehydrogenase
MKLNGKSLIGGSLGEGRGETWQATNPATGEELEPVFYAETLEGLDRAVALAEDAFVTYGESSGDERAKFLRAIADEIDAVEDAIVSRMTAETALPEGRCRGEKGRTVGQLRMFADLVEEGSWVDARIDRAQPDREPAPKPDLRSMERPLGPVAVFCASNFPLAYSVAGGDTASALAAGCPVIVRAHSAHPGVAEIVGRAIQKAVISCQLPEGVFSLVFDDGIQLGEAIAKHPGITAIGFTGSRKGGRALMDYAAARPVPIPVYAEMSSINPIFILPGALAERGVEIGDGLVGSVSLGVGQFCTSPGLVFLPGEGDDAFVTQVSKGLSAVEPITMLHQGIAQNFRVGVSEMANQQRVTKVTEVPSEDGSGKGAPVVFRAPVAEFLSNSALSSEMFGPATVLVDCDSADDYLAAADALEGQLTATVHGTEEDLANAKPLLNMLSKRAGRLVINGFPTGVEVCPSIVHGGPYPATSDGRTTSVGTRAITRFSRLVAWQDCPENLLPVDLQSANLSGIWRIVDGKFSKKALSS